MSRHSGPIKNTQDETYSSTGEPTRSGPGPDTIVQKPTVVQQPPALREFNRARKQLWSRRIRASRGRLRLQQDRLGIRDLRDEVRRLESELIAVLRKMVSSQGNGEPQASPSSMLLDRIQQMDETLCSREDKYDDDEDALANDEDQLEREEQGFYGKYDRDLFPDDPIETSTDSRSSSPKSSRNVPPSEYLQSPPVEDPLFHEYQTKIGEVNIVKERLGMLPLALQEHLDEQERLKSLGQDMDPSDLEFLQNYGSIVEDHKAEIAIIERSILDLELELKLQGTMDDFEAYRPDASFFPTPVAAADPEGSPEEEEQATPDPDDVAPVPMSLAIPPPPPPPPPPVHGHGLRATTTQVGGRLYREFNPSPATLPIRNILQWLKDLPSVALPGLSGNPKALIRRDNSIVRYCHNVIGSWRKEEKKRSSRPDEPLNTGWVSVEPIQGTSRSRSLSLLSHRRDPNRPGTGGSLIDIGGFCDPNLEPSLESSPPNRLHGSPLDLVMDPSTIGDQESRSI